MINLERGSKQKAMSEPVDHLGRMMLIWHWIEAWLQAVAPESLAHLYKGATEQQLQSVEIDAVGGTSRVRIGGRAGEGLHFNE